MRENKRGGEELLREEARRLLADFAFTGMQKRELWDAFLASPEGLERCALRAKAVGKREGRPAAGLLLSMVRAGEHLLEEDPSALRPTGWRRVRGSHGDNYVRDPEGIDPLPPGFDLVTHSPFSPLAREES
jgi:hypothetical protein